MASPARKQRDTGLSHSCEALELAQRAAGAGYWEWDLIADRVAWSQQFRVLYGLAATAVPSFATWVVRIHSDDRKRVESGYRQALESGLRQHQHRFRILTGGSVRDSSMETEAEAEARWIADTIEIEFASPAKAARAKALRLTGFSIDITAQKRAEEALQRSDKLTIAGRFAAAVAHEINNPLEIVANLVYLAKIEPSQAKTREYLAMVEQELTRINTIARQTLDFYREGRHAEPLDLREVVRTSLNLVKRRARSKNTVIDLELNEPVIVRAVTGEIIQVVVNLLSNAIDASPESGTLCLRVRRRGERALITLSDQGQGIPREYRARIFEPFFTTKKESGTGLGLWVVRSIIERHGGTIRFRTSSRPSHSGTVFRVCLPL